MFCPVGFSEQFFAVFLVTMSQIDTKNDKNPKLSIFQCFYAFFDKLSTVLVDSKILKRPEETFCCPVGSFEEIIAVL